MILCQELQSLQEMGGGKEPGTSVRGVRGSDRSGPGPCGSTHAGAVVFARFDAAGRPQERGADGGTCSAPECALGASVDASPGGGRGLERSGTARGGDGTGAAESVEEGSVVSLDHR